MDTAQKNSDENRLFSGRFFSSGPIDVGQGDRGGVVLLVPGAPESKGEVFSYLYRRFMLPGLKSSGIKYWASHVRSRFKARMATPRVISEYKAIGGGATINLFNREQADDLSRRLKASAIVPDGVKVSTYLASPFGTPSMKDAAIQMSEDGITHVVLLPLFPQYAADTTGRALAHWEEMVTNLEIATRPTVAVWEFAVRDSFVAALNERIDQALQRFPRQLRSNVALLFAAHGKTEKPSSKKGDPYCCLVHHTVDRVMEMRSHDRPFSLSFVQERGWGTRFANRLKVNLDRLIGSGVRAIVVVPVDHVTEQFDTAYLLDVELRQLAEEKGVTHYQVASGLNCHSLFMEGLADMVLDSIVPSSKRSLDEACIQACPREHWNSSTDSNEAGCTVCPFSAPGMAKEQLRPSKSHAQSSHNPSRPAIRRA